MHVSNDWVSLARRDIYSQDGEDGIIETILAVLPKEDLDNFCVEFGAWDGIHCCNTRHLIETKNYSAVLIEADKKRFEQLQRNYSSRATVFPVNAFVGFTPSDNLDVILSEFPIPVKFDLLSVDIDGNDYHVWKAVKNFHPKIVCIEFNPTIPNEVNYIQAADANVSKGSSLKAFNELAKSKSYELVALSAWNAFFVLKEYFHLFKITDNTPEALRTDKRFITWLFFGIDGAVHLDGNKTMAWHGLPIKEEKLQLLPKRLRKNPFWYSKVDRIMFRIFKRLK